MDELKIEKVTRMVSATDPSRSTSGSFRMVPMSLPRVRWLERDVEKPGAIEPVTVTLPQVQAARMKKGELDEPCFELHCKGYSFENVAKMLGIGKTSARKFYMREKSRREAHERELGRLLHGTGM
jgi:hypothetical protein